MPSTSYGSILTSKAVLILAALILVGLVFWLGRAGGYSAGYAKAQADFTSLGEEATQKATAEAAKVANPFQAVNPLEGVEANPFEKVKKVLNPFEN